MRPFAALLLMTLTGLLIAADAPPRADDAQQEKPHDVQKEKAKLDGTWMPVSFESALVTLGEDLLKSANMTYVLKGDKLTIKHGDKVVGQATVQIDPNRLPKTMDTKSESKEHTLCAIYKLEQDTLTSCYRTAPAQRPKKFASDGYAILVTMRREKP